MSSKVEMSDEMPLSLREVDLPEALYGDKAKPMDDDEAAYTEEELDVEDDDDEPLTGQDRKDMIELIGFDPHEWDKEQTQDSCAACESGDCDLHAI